MQTSTIPKLRICTSMCISMNINNSKLQQNLNKLNMSLMGEMMARGGTSTQVSPSLLDHIVNMEQICMDFRLQTLFCALYHLHPLCLYVNSFFFLLISSFLSQIEKQAIFCPYILMLRTSYVQQQKPLLMSLLFGKAIFI